MKFKDEYNKLWNILKLSDEDFIKNYIENHNFLSKTLLINEPKDHKEPILYLLDHSKLNHLNSVLDNNELNVNVGIGIVLKTLYSQEIFHIFIPKLLNHPRFDYGFNFNFIFNLLRDVIFSNNYQNVKKMLSIQIINKKFIEYICYLEISIFDRKEIQQIDKQILNLMM
jgi:hypothetical protein